MLVDSYPDTFALVQMRYNCTGTTPWGNARFDFYGATGTPAAYFDGVLECAGDLGDLTLQYEWYEDQYEARRAIPTDVTISVLGYSLGEQTYRISARVCLEAGGTPKTVRIYVVQVLDHFTELPEYSRNGFKQAAETVDISLVPDECQTILTTFELDDGSWLNQENIRMIVWAQEPLPSGPAEVFQVGVGVWPLPPDCNGNGIPDDEDISGGTSPDINTNGLPDECEDCNTNGVVDSEDIAQGTSPDCNTNGIPDECDVWDWTSPDCNLNGIPDECDVAAGTSQDINGNDVPDECECRGDCDCDGAVTFLDINYFVVAIYGWEAWVDYHIAHTGSPPSCPWGNCNADGDPTGSVTFLDIVPFVNLLGRPCQMH